MKQETKRVEEKLEIPRELVLELNQDRPGIAEGYEDAAVTASVSTKVSDAVYWGEGTWDKIPYSVEIFSSVTLKCNQDPETIKLAHNLAYDMAWDASREHILKARNGHVMDIRNRLYPELFDDVRG